MGDVLQTLILGSGPAGYTAAIYAARGAMNPVLLAGPQPGGQLTITSDVENYPGFPEGLQGPHMMELFQKQAERFGTVVKHVNAVRCELKQRPFRVWDSNDQSYTSQTVIIATGASAIYLGLPNETKLQSRGVSACATCDAYFFKGKNVYVVGGGDSAAEEATFLTKYAAKVNMVVRRDALRASKIMAKRAIDNPKISMLWNTQVTDVFDASLGRVTGLELTDSKTGARRNVSADGLFLAIGHKPNTEIFRGQLALDEKGYLKTVAGRAATEIPGVFACGDCQDSYYRQAVTAAGSGCMAAIEAERWLEGQHG